jgi:hypothetical protein
MVLNNMKYIVTTTLIAFVLNNCGGGSDKNSWGIDGESGILLPICNGDKNTTTNAVSLLPTYTIEPLLENTNILIWHYSNADKDICVVTGKAIMKESK